MSGHVVVAGNNTVDLCFIVNSFPTEGTKHQAEQFAAFGGGQASNVAADLAILGAPVAFIGDFGDDKFGALARRDLEAAGVDLKFSRTPDSCAHSVAAILVDQSKHERTIVWHRPAELARVTPQWLVENAFDGAAAFYTDAVLFEQSLALAKLAASRNIPVFSDLETLPDGVHEFLEYVNYLVAPHEVLSQLAGGESPGRIAALATPTRVVVATRGAHGSWLFQHGEACQEVPVVPCNVVDTTGAGDAYHAGFLQVTLAGHSPLDACRFASFVASAACSVFGPRLRPDMNVSFSLTINHQDQIQ